MKKKKKNRNEHCYPNGFHGGGRWCDVERDQELERRNDGPQGVCATNGEGSSGIFWHRIPKREDTLGVGQDMSESSVAQTTLRLDHRYRKLEMLIFSGENPDEWLLKAESFFDIHKFSEAERLEAAVVAFEGDTLLWYLWEHKQRAILSWAELRRLLLKHFSNNRRHVTRTMDGFKVGGFCRRVSKTVHRLHRSP